MKTKGFQIAWPIRTALYFSLGALFLTGILWLGAHYLLREESDFGYVPSPLEPVTMQIHGALVPIFLLLLGALFPLHISRAYKAKLNLLSGACLLSSLLALIISGYFLYYAGGEYFRLLTSSVHSIIGVLVAPALLFHIVRGKALARRIRH